MGGEVMEKKRLIRVMTSVIFIFTVILFIGLVFVDVEDDAFQIILPKGTGKLYRPIEIKDVLEYRDGGTIGIVLKDSKERTFSFCYDGRAIIVPWFDTYEEIVKYEEEYRLRHPRHIYVGATYPDEAGAQKIPVGGKEEQSILQLLENIMEEKLSEDERLTMLESIRNSGSDACYTIAANYLKSTGGTLTEDSSAIKSSYDDCFVLVLMENIRHRLNSATAK